MTMTDARRKAVDLALERAGVPGKGATWVC